MSPIKRFLRDRLKITIDVPTSGDVNVKGSDSVQVGGAGNSMHNKGPRWQTVLTAAIGVAIILGVMQMFGAFEGLFHHFLSEC